MVWLVKLILALPVIAALGFVYAVIGPPTWLAVLAVMLIFLWEPVPPSLDRGFADPPPDPAAAESRLYRQLFGLDN